ncbi:hypothetical protein FA09DRAFT_329252 [Tilletiopsis washingtonensis]|uniref:Uncharacterized protein n=1 Tax=Tilletiopsis washingtonensis TaxID=58919 RepID=A0A316ZAM9_9BASI|nr:hypothetical protein FA09DRAFT_329252 [Tilletiopsis washingtonensis]PWN98750.1 hypothetical protein FA09DRAFT_329252 [Tilletiopsis washingtonensis]
MAAAARWRRSGDLGLLLHTRRAGGLGRAWTTTSTARRGSAQPTDRRKPARSPGSTVPRALAARAASICAV